jgi:hypothetical protein
MSMLRDADRPKDGYYHDAGKVSMLRDADRPKDGYS